jgi:hypothetical protein
MVTAEIGRGHVSISSIGIQTVTPSTGTKAGQQASQQQQQQSAANDNASQVAAKSSSSQTTGQYVDKHV